MSYDKETLENLAILNNAVKKIKLGFFDLTDKLDRDYHDIKSRHTREYLQ